MKKHHWLASAIVIISVLLLVWNPKILQSENTIQAKYDQSLKLNKESSIRNYDDIASRTSKDLIKEELDKLVDGSAIGKMNADKLKEFIESLDGKKDKVIIKIGENYESQIDKKRDSILKYFEGNHRKEVQIKNLESSQKRINYPLIIAIILLAGILGGYARRYYPYLQNVLEMAKKADNKLKTVTDKSESVRKELVNRSALKGLTGGALSDFSLIRQETVEITNEANEAKNELNKLIEHLSQEVSTESKEESIMANLLFGIIASSLAIVALGASASDVLKFQEGTDYLILWAWCCMFSIFAKNLIESLVSSIKGKIGK